MPSRPSVHLLASILALAATPGAFGAACNDVSWLNPASPPPFLTDINQAPGTGDCQFQEFASWNFMSLVLGPNPRFESWPTLEQVYPASGPPTCSGAKLGSALQPVIDQDGSKLPAQLKARTLLKAPGGADDSVASQGAPVQATGQPLVDRNGRYIQYEMRVNPAMCAAVTACNFQVQACGVAAAAMTNPSFGWPSGIPGTTSPGTGTPGAAELKLSWQVMETCMLPDSPANCTPTDLSQFFWVENVHVDSLSPKWQGSATVTIGLVGFHLIQKTPSRPEFVWATWEHVSNDPVCPGSDNSVCHDPSHASGGIGASGWTLYDPNVNPAPLVNTPPQCPDPVAFGPAPTQANCLNQPYYDANLPQNQPKTEVCRLAPCGGGDQSEIADLNEAIRSKLAGNVWWNYFLVGTVWGNSTATPTGPSQSAGSIYLANTTMETYFQAHAQTPAAGQFNCFTCHNPGGSGNYTDPNNQINLDFVHSIQKAQQTTPTQCPVDVKSCVAMVAAHKTKK